MSDTGLVITALVTSAIAGGLNWLFLTMSLQVEVRSDALHIHFKPLKRRTVQNQDVALVEACQYRPILDYGGWGIRRGR